MNDLYFDRASIEIVFVFIKSLEKKKTKPNNDFYIAIEIFSIFKKKKKTKWNYLNKEGTANCEVEFNVFVAVEIWILFIVWIKVCVYIRVE